jgi:hypothetical protein
LLLYMFTVADQARIVAWIRRPNGSWQEATPPAELPSGKVTVLALTGGAYFASAYRAEQAFPAHDRTIGAAVVLQLRDRAFYSLTAWKDSPPWSTACTATATACTWPTSTRPSAPPCPVAGCWPCSALTRSCGATPSSARRQPRPPAERGRGWPATAPNLREVHLHRSICETARWFGDDPARAGGSGRDPWND